MILSDYWTQILKPQSNPNFISLIELAQMKGNGYKNEKNHHLSSNLYLFASLAASFIENATTTLRRRRNRENDIERERAVQVRNGTRVWVRSKGKFCPALTVSPPVTTLDRPDKQRRRTNGLSFGEGVFGLKKKK